MEYIKKVIKIHVKKAILLVSALVAEGTGLAIVAVKDHSYNIVQTVSGCSIAVGVATVRAAQWLLEHITTCYDWRIPLPAPVQLADLTPDLIHAFKCVQDLRRQA